MHGIGLLRMARPAPTEAAARAGWQAMRQGRFLRVSGEIYKVFAFAPRPHPASEAARMLSMAAASVALNSSSV